MMKIAVGRVTSTVAERGWPVITPISPTVVTGRIVATFMPSGVTMAPSPESRMYISSLGVLLRQTNSPGSYCLLVHSDRMRLTCEGERPVKIGIFRRTWISSFSLFVFGLDIVVMDISQ